jgi:hypothetical protein
MENRKAIAFDMVHLIGTVLILIHKESICGWRLGSCSQLRLVLITVLEAIIMAILESTDIPHPAIEALFTDEETGDRRVEP